jgi:hypothetical protein
MRIPARGLGALHGGLIAAVVVLWNAAILGGLALSMDEPGARPIRGLGTLPLSIVSLAISLLAFAIVAAPAARRVLFARKRADRYEPAPFVLVGLVCGLIGLAPLLNLLR